MTTTWTEAPGVWITSTGVEPVDPDDPVVPDGPDGPVNPNFTG